MDTTNLRDFGKAKYPTTLQALCPHGEVGYAGAAMWSQRRTFTPCGKPTARLDCKQCRGPLRLQRTCLSVRLHCPKCGGVYELSDYADQADAVEDFLASVPCDRI